MSFATAQSTEGWYQIDVVVFANNSTTDTDEVWPLTERRYPDKMVSIGPENANDLRPETLGQLEDLEKYLALWDQTIETGPQSAGATEFLFESRSNPSRSNPRRNLPEEEVEEDPSAEIPEEIIDYDSLFAIENAVAYQDLPANERLLNAAARSIRRSSLFDLLLHHSWVQPIVSAEDATPVLLQAGKRYDSTYELDGTITLSRSRFLHISTDLWFTRFAPLIQEQASLTSATNRLISPLDGRLAISPALREKYPEVADWMSNREQYIPVHSHHLSQSRRMRSATLHFIDHPQFGVLVRIERYTPPEDQS